MERMLYYIGSAHWREYRILQWGNDSNYIVQYRDPCAVCWPWRRWHDRCHSSGWDDRQRTEFRSLESAYTAIELDVNEMLNKSKGYHVVKGTLR